MKQEMKDLARGFIYSMVLMGIVVVLLGVWMAVRYYSAPTVGKVQMEINTTNGRAQEFSYNTFFDQCAAIQGYESALVIQRHLLDKAEGDDRTRIATNVAAISAQRARAITQYNADARKVLTLARFKDSGLPEEINLNVENTQCRN